MLMIQILILMYLVFDSLQGKDACVISYCSQSETKGCEYSALLSDRQFDI